MKNKKYFVSSPVRVKVACLCQSGSHHTTPTPRNKNLIRFLESFVILPVFALSAPVGALVGSANVEVSNKPPQIVLSQYNTEVRNLLAFNQVVDDNTDESRDAMFQKRALAIDTYFKTYNMPLAGKGLKFVTEADKHGLDWRLLPAIAVRETTGGKHLCTTLSVENNKNPFGWGSCKIGFKSFDESIEVLARNLSGNNPKTDHYYPKNTATEKILRRYNSVIKNYVKEVVGIMNTISNDKNLGDEDVKVTA